MNLAQLFRKILPFVKPYRHLVLITLVLTLIGSLLAQVNAIVLDRAVDAINALVGAEDFNWSRAVRILSVISIVLFAKELLSAGITFSQKFFGEKLRNNISKNLSLGVIDRILGFRMAFFARNDNAPGMLQARIEQGVNSISRTVQNFFIDLLPMFVSAALALVLIFAANIYVGLTALAVVPVYFHIAVRQARKLKGWRRNMRSFFERRSSGVMNIIESMNVVKSFNRESIELDKQDELQSGFYGNQMKVRRASFYYDSLKSFVNQTGTVLIIILTAYLVLSGYPGMSIGKIMYHILLFSNVTAPITQLQRIFDDLNDAMVYAEGYFDIVEADSETEKSGTYRPEKVLGNFEIRGVDFTYPNGNKALHDIDIKVESGKITALVGLSGAGKSTIVNLLDKFYEPDCGSITLDGVDLREWDTRFLRDNIGLVLQKNHIFDGSIEENIRYGKPDATFEEVEQAARKAAVYEQIIALPEGFASAATRLSGGQQQRIALARMFLKNPPVIFLDEPTASLDAIATEQIKSAIDEIKRNRTVIIISHSISQIIDSDIVYALKDGRVEQGGEPDELYKKGGVYKDIVDASARSLNIEKLAQTLDSDGDGVFFNS
ncbi:MAG: ABC transporter ATP-binding protein [Bacteroidales bacterium]|nr:ABC transporter ATP-binding protein [Bacteroidales bacterium]